MATIHPSNFGSARAWLCLSKAHNRAHAGNDGYEDETSFYYLWDSTIPNYMQVRTGDIIVLWDEEKLLGISLIDDIKTRARIKSRYRCPKCKSTKIKRRLRKVPEFKCGNQVCKAEFDQPTTEQIQIVEYRANYSSSWRPLLGSLNGRECRALAKSQRSQHSIREIADDRLKIFLSKVIK